MDCPVFRIDGGRHGTYPLVLQEMDPREHSHRGGIMEGVIFRRCFYGVDAYMCQERVSVRKWKVSTKDRRGRVHEEVSPVTYRRKIYEMIIYSIKHREREGSYLKAVGH